MSEEADVSFNRANPEVADKDEEQTGTWSELCSGETSQSGPGKYEEVGKDGGGERGDGDLSMDRIKKG